MSKSTAFVLLFALGFHALFGGIAFGLLEDLPSAVQLAGGMILHTPAEAISMGGALANTGYTFREIFVLVFLFSLIAPGGVIIGLILSETNLLLDTILVCISGGTFVYVACSEIIIGEFDKGKHQWFKMLCVIAGCAVITCLWFFHGHSHAPGEGHGHAHL